MSWQTQTFRELNTRVGQAVGGKTASALEKLGIRTIGDLLRHCPRRYVSGTDMSDFARLTVDDEVALIARVHRAEHAVGRSKQRVKVTLTDGRRYLGATFFADKDHLVRHWLRVLAPGARGIFVGKVSEFNGALQLSHPDFVVLDEHNRMVAGSRGERQQAMVRQTQRDTLVGNQRRARLERVIAHLVSRQGVVLSTSERNQLIRRVVDEAVGLGVLEPILADPSVSEIMVNGPDTIYVEREGVLERWPTGFSSTEQMLQTIDRIVSSDPLE